MIADMQQRMLAMQAELQSQRQRDATMTQLTSVLERLSEAKPPAAPAILVDTRGIGKPGQFGPGTDEELKKKFPNWQRKTANFVLSVYPDLKPALEWAAVRPDPITEEELSPVFGEDADETERIPALNDKCHQLYSMLLQLTEGEPNDVVSNSRDHGLEAWRKLTRRWDPSTGGRARAILKNIISPGRTSLQDLAGSLERWEERVSRYRATRVEAQVPQWTKLFDRALRHIACPLHAAGREEVICGIAGRRQRAMQVRQT